MRSRRLLLVLTAAASLTLQGCADRSGRDLSTLIVVDSLYVDPASGAPVTGAVYRRFEDESQRTQVEGSLTAGEWDGEFRVYHPNGHIRYMGSFHAGDRCGAWTENADSVPTRSVYDELVDEIESLGVYPPCPER